MGVLFPLTVFFLKVDTQEILEVDTQETLKVDTQASYSVGGQRLGMEVRVTAPWQSPRRFW